MTSDKQNELKPISAKEKGEKLPVLRVLLRITAHSCVHLIILTILWLSLILSVLLPIKYLVSIYYPNFSLDSSRFLTAFILGMCFYTGYALPSYFKNKTRILSILYPIGLTILSMSLVFYSCIDLRYISLELMTGSMLIILILLNSIFIPFCLVMSSRNLLESSSPQNKKWLYLCLLFNSIISIIAINYTNSYYASEAYKWISWLVE